MVCVIIFALGVRGNYGNPSSRELSFSGWKEDGPFELSPERGRFALLYSFMEDHSLNFSIPLARFSAPDIAVNSKGQYASLFMPGVSFLVIPGYVLGKYFGASQVGTFAMISIFALANIFLIRAIVIRLGANKIAASLAGFTFVFATPAFAYGVTLYQHHISTFIILLSLYILLRWKNAWSLGVIWFLCALSVVIDNPNFFLMLPIGIYALGRIISFEKIKTAYVMNIKPVLFLTLITVAIPVGFFLWFNKASYGNPLQLPGTSVSVAEIDENGKSVEADTKSILTGSSRDEVSKEKTAVGFFQTRNLLNGLYIHTLSPDRGILRFAPVILLGIIGMVLLYRRNKEFANLLTVIIGINVLLYSMWGDPWGGWAFGSRYLIPTYALLAIGLGIVLSKWSKKIWFLVIFAFLFVYSAGVGTLGALTSNVNPPQVQVLQLEKISGTIQRYSFDRNWQFLNESGSKSFIFRTFARNIFSAQTYYFSVYGLIVITGIFMLTMLAININKQEDIKK